MKTLISIAVVSLVVVTGAESKGREQGDSHSGGHRGNFSGNKTMVDVPMHQRGGKEISRGDMMTHALKNPEMAEKIGLSEEQQQKITKKLEKIEDKNLDLKYKMEKASLKQARLMTAKELDEEALMAVVDELGKYRTQMAKQRIGMLVFMRKTLTDEQITNMRRVMHERVKERRNEHSGDWRRNAKNSSENKQKMEANRRHREEDHERNER